MAIKVDRTRYADSRWYTGSGIYRNVKLITTNKLHIPIWGTYITTPEVSRQQATVNIMVKVKNEDALKSNFDILTEIYDPEKIKVASRKESYFLSDHSEQAFSRQFQLDTPQLWDTENPNLYRAIVSIWHEGKVVDKYETPFGIRSILFDADDGFFLNGKNMKIKGVCLHHDGGLVGAAVPKGVWRRRFQKLKEGGCNAIRISHNPGSGEFIDLCDEMGILVQNEFFDEWDYPKDKRLNQGESTSTDYITRGYTEHFQQWAEKDLKATMLRDRNHPSIIQWSIGNEIEWTYPRYAHATGFFDMGWQGNYFFSPPPISSQEIRKRYEESPAGTYVLAETARKLADWTRELDKTRPVIANCILPSASHETGYADALDIVGYSYRRILYDYGHKLYPDKVIMGTENLGQWHEWKSVMERPFISGTFLWTGINYMGEAHDRWPRKGSDSGLLDFAGFEKPSYHIMKTLWNEEPHVYLATQNLEKSIYKVAASGEVEERKPGAWKQALWGWHDVNEHWNYAPSELIIVEVYSNCEEVELFLNGQSQGLKKLSDFEDRIYKWGIPFKAGTLMAEGKHKSGVVSTTLITTSEPTGVSLKADKKTLKADGYDIAHVVAQLIDKKGNPVKNKDLALTFELEGNGKILGVDNGAVDNVQDYQSNKILTANGRCLLIIQSLQEVTTLTITARNPKLNNEPIVINVE